MTIDLKKIKETAQAVADRSGELLVTIPAGEMLELVRDAERYRWLRDPSASIVVRDLKSHMRGGYMDEQVDAAMAKEAE